MPDRDFMGMAQGAGAPAQEITEQDLQMTNADYEEVGLPAGDNPEAIKERILMTLEQAGVMEDLEAAEKQEIMQLVDQLINDIEAGNMEAVEQNPIMQLLSGLFEQMGAEELGAEGGEPADMAGMAGMGGGGMPGGGMPPMPGGGM